MKEQVEIVMATYNGEKYIKEQLDSLLSQSYPDLLVDVCDDGSTDDTVSIVKEYEKKDRRVRLFENKTNQGYIRNFMSGIVRCDSPYIMLCDQDDIWNRDKVELTLEKMKQMERENPEKPVLVFTDAMNFDSSTGKKLGRFHEMSHLNVKKVDTAHLFMENKCIGCTIMMNRVILPYLRELPEEIRVHDWWLALICSHFGKVVYVDKMTLHYRQHSDNMIGTSSFFQYVAKRIRHIKEQKEALRATFAQGTAFYRMFGGQITDPERKKCAYEFAKMSENNAVKRRFLALRYGFLKSGLVRNLALMFLI